MKKELSILLILIIITSHTFFADNHKSSKGIHSQRFTACDERKPAYKRRVGAAYLRTHTSENYCIENENNGDEKRVAGFAANFSKTFPHDSTGILTREGRKSYRKLIKGLNCGNQSEYNQIMRSKDAIFKLVNPQGSATFSLLGIDSSQTKLPLFPQLNSKESAAQILEVYLLAAARDVLFQEYGTESNTDKDTINGGSITKNAAAILTNLGTSFKGPTNSTGEVDTSVLFRGNNSGSVVGPYISQFLYLPISIPASSFPQEVGMGNISLEVFDKEQKNPVPSQRNFGTTINNFVAIQNGQIPEPYQKNDFNTDPSKNRYIITGRDLASLVHFDVVYQIYYNATLSMFRSGFPLCPQSPYENGSMPNEASFVNLGPVDILTLVALAAQEGAKAAWAHKWRAQRVARPEAYAGLIHNAKQANSNPYGLNNMLFESHPNINVLDWIQSINGIANTCLMPLVYPEGSPCHPSYPAGHAVISGACITILKAFFDDQEYLINIPGAQPVIPNKDGSELLPLTDGSEQNLTVGKELNKLAANIAIGRNFAGIHYRADGDEGMLLGEKVGIKILQDHAVTLTEQEFTGFELTKIDGTRIYITAECVEEVCS